MRKDNCIVAVPYLRIQFFFRLEFKRKLLRWKEKPAATGSTEQQPEVRKLHII